MRDVHIENGSIVLVASLMRQLPEFDTPYGENEMAERLNGVPHLILVAWAKGTLAGFKVGYERDGFFYSWLGGVLPEYRQLGIAKALADKQEEWATAQGYDAIIFKTRNRHKAMLSFALQNGFDVIGFEEKEKIEEHRIWLRKAIPKFSS